MLSNIQILIFLIILLQVWDPLTGDTTHVLMEHDGWVRGVKLRGHHVVSGSEDSTVRYAIQTCLC